MPYFGEKKILGQLFLKRPALTGPCPRQSTTSPGSLAGSLSQQQAGTWADKAACLTAWAQAWPSACRLTTSVRTLSETATPMPRSISQRHFHQA